MINKYILMTIGIFLLNNILIWYQLNSQLVWAVRFVGFATSMLTFPIMTWLYLGEVITLKTLITILLAIIIMILQLL